MGDALISSLAPHWGGAVAAFIQVVMIDLTLAGDNAVAVGLAAAGLPKQKQRQAIILGMGGAVVMLIAFALLAVQLLKFVGLLLIGGLLLLWVCWRMFRDLRAQARGVEDIGEEVLEGKDVAAPRKTLMRAMLQILAADISMSLDNVLAVAGAARQHPQVLIFGLALSVTLTGLAAAWIAKLLHSRPWLAYLGLVIVFYVALHMTWEGSRAVAMDLGGTKEFNAIAPDWADIKPAEIAKRLEHKR
jgi:YjbE family integral membrane protein